MIFNGILGYCGSREVLLGFAPAASLAGISFADVLNEDTGTGYQRRFNEKHSLDFRKYIQQPGSTTIPLTFNLRPRIDNAWQIKRYKNGTATLKTRDGITKVLSQVDCQHRLGYLTGLDIPLPFMIFVGLDEKEEMSIFNVINGKAKGLNSSLLDYHEANLATNLARDKPELFIALKLNDDKASPWYKRLDLGGKQISGMTRKASLRTMQKAVKRFLHETQISGESDINKMYSILLDYWRAVVFLLEDVWENPRKHFLTKGIGVYALNSIAADLYKETINSTVECNYNYFVTTLSEFLVDFDWSNTGQLKGLGGESGVREAVSKLRSARNAIQLGLISNA